MVRPRVFLDIQHGTEPLGRVVIELFNDHTPKTCENFRLLCTNARPPITLPNGRTCPLYYQGAPFHRIIPEFMIQGGDITMGTGTGGASTFEDGKAFADEALGWREIDKDGLVCMANRGAGTNTSQFFITLADCSYLTQKHTLFGHVASGMDVVKKMEDVSVDKKDRPTEDLIIANCGELEFRKKEKTEPVTKAKEITGTRHGNRRSRSRSRSLSEDHSRKSRRNGDGEKHHRHRRRRSPIGSPSHSKSPSRLLVEEPRGRSHSPREPLRKSPEVNLKRDLSPSPPPRRHRHRRHSNSRSRSPRRRSPSPRSHRHRHRRSRSPRHSRRYHDRDLYHDDPDVEERIRREEREREMVRQDGRAPPPPQVSFKGRGSMKYRERKHWGGGGEYGRLN